MLRAVLLGLLTLSAVSCKSSGESQGKSQPGVAAGKVVEVKGAVTLYHGTEARQLAKGEAVDADDIVETGADGSVVIELQHNHVNWELGPNKKTKVRESLAWSQPKKDTSAKAAEEDSAAAGRHAERNAAGNSATANERERADVEAAKDSAPAAAIAPAPVVAQTAPPAQAAPTTATPPPPPPPPPPKAAVTAMKKSAAKSAGPPAPGGGAANADFEGGLGLSGTGKGGGGTGEGTIGLGNVGTLGHGGGTGTGQGYGAGGAKISRSMPETPTAVALALVRTKRKDLSQCLAEGENDARLVVNVDAAGKPTIQFKIKLKPESEACMKQVIDGLSFDKTATESFTILVKKA